MLVRSIRELRSDDAELDAFGEELAELRRKLPSELRQGPAGLRLDDLDYLRAETEPVGAWMAVSPSNREHQWAAALAERPGLATVSDFGASDCRCRTHLFHARAWAEVAHIAGALSKDAAWFEV